MPDGSRPIFMRAKDPDEKIWEEVPFKGGPYDQDQLVAAFRGVSDRFKVTSNSWAQISWPGRFHGRLLTGRMIIGEQTVVGPCDLLIPSVQCWQVLIPVTIDGQLCVDLPES
jgi:hypothetical protein